MNELTTQIVRNVDPQYLERYPYYARHGQDQFLHEVVFKDLQGGVFVDLGAYDGVESSNTLFFEETLEWKGLCVEPLPHIFSKLMANRNCICKNVCALDRYGKATLQHIIPRTQSILPAHTGRRPNIEKLSGLTEYFHDKHIEMMNKMIVDHGGNSEDIAVDCMPVNDLLALVSSRINLLSIDTEGSELAILRAVDFDRFQIDVIVVEVLFLQQEFASFMHRHGYDFVATIGYDSIYKKN